MYHILARRSVGFLAASFLFISEVRATELSGNLVSEQLDEVVGISVVPSVHRSWTAHAVPTEGLGLDLGVESAFVARGNLNDLGDGLGVAPRIIPVPRFYMAWDLPAEFKLSASFAPGMLFDGITTFGLGTQWVFHREPEIATALSVVGAYTFVNVFGDLTSNQFALAAQASRDLAVWQPYAGLGFVQGMTSFDARVLAPGALAGGERHGQWTWHAYLGFRVDLIAKLSFQVDFFDLRPAIALLLQHGF